MRGLFISGNCSNCQSTLQMEKSSIRQQFQRIVQNVHIVRTCRSDRRNRLRAVGESGGVDSLLARDRKNVKDVKFEELDKAFQDFADEKPAVPTAEEPVTESASTSTAPSKRSSGKEADKGPRTSREAIMLGIEVLNGGDPERAITLFQKALELPGNGAMRFSGTVREYRCASEAEENAALYNMACAYAAMGQKEPALTCLEAALDNGFDDFATLRNDPDLLRLRGPDLDKLLGKHDGIFAKLFGRKKKDRGGTEPIFLGF